MSESAAPERDTVLTIFQSHRPRMLGIAYRMLGTLADAEDVLQETYVRWHQLAATQTVDNPQALLATLTTRLCIDRYRRERSFRAAYAGPWLPEPVTTPVDEPLASLESERLLSLGLLRVLEHLAPLERAVFVLADAFDYRAREIAGVVGRSEAHCRQLLHRARRSLAALSPAPDEDCGSDKYYIEGRRLLEGLFDAVRRGHVEEVERLLAADVVMYSDGGGKVSAVTRPVRGSRAVARLLVGLARQLADRPALEHIFLAINGCPGVMVKDDRGVDSALVFEHGSAQVHAAFVQRNPDKLARLAPLPSALSNRA